MAHPAQILLLVVYAILPPGMILLALTRPMPLRLPRLVSVLFTCCWGALIGGAIAILTPRILGGVLSLAEHLRLIYAVISVMCLLRLIDRLTLKLIFHLARVRLDFRGRPIEPNRLRALTGLTLQRLLMLAITIPYIFAMGLIYRPHLMYPGEAAKLKLEYIIARFGATDGPVLSGWWMPAAPRPNLVEADLAEQWGTHTAILCHGLYGGKEQHLRLAKLLTKNGMNVLAFDLRGQGQSGGQFSSLGDLERFDVLAAVRWLKNQHPQQTQRIFALGSNTGAAAVLAAAAQEGDGQLIDALVLYEPFSDFNALFQTTTRQALPRGVNWLVAHLTLPIASLHVGGNLSAFAPIDHARRIWPRPILLIHGRGQSFVPTIQEMSLFQALDFPKEQFWPADNSTQTRRRLRKIGDGNRMVIDLFRQWLGLEDAIAADPTTQEHTLQFLLRAENQPVL